MQSQVIGRYYANISGIRGSINVSAAPDDGVTDATPNLQQAIDGTPVGDTLILSPPKVAYLITAPLLVTKPITIVGRRSIIKQSTGGESGIQITSSHVTLQGVSLTGPQVASENPAEKAITVIGADSQHPLTDIEIIDCEMNTWGMYGIYMQYVNGFTIRDCLINNIFYGGIMGLSVLNGTIGPNNTVSNVTGSVSGNAYGIAVTRITTNSQELVSDPCSQNILVIGNKVNNVPAWAGLNTHGGVKISFVNNQIYGCPHGIEVVPCPNSSGAIVYPPIDCLVQGNTVDSGVTDGSAVYGVTVSGAITTISQITGLAEGCQVVGNTVRGYGSQAQAAGLGMALYIVGTRGVSIVGNTVLNAGQTGVGFYFGNYGFTCTGNTIKDPWTNTGRSAIGINIISNYNVGHVGGNTYVRGTLAATNVLNIGLNVRNDPSVVITHGAEYCDAATKVAGPVCRRSVRSATIASSATPTISTDTTEFFSITQLATAITSFTVIGTPNIGDTLWVSITNNGVARSINWGSSFESSGSLLLPVLTQPSIRLDVGFVWNEVTSKWRCVALA